MVYVRTTHSNEQWHKRQKMAFNVMFRFDVDFFDDEISTASWWVSFWIFAHRFHFAFAIIVQSNHKNLHSFLNLRFVYLLFSLHIIYFVKIHRVHLNNRWQFHAIFFMKINPILFKIRSSKISCVIDSIWSIQWIAMNWIQSVLELLSYFIYHSCCGQ